jgi:hypothetical protein
VHRGLGARAAVGELIERGAGLPAQHPHMLEPERGGGSAQRPGRWRRSRPRPGARGIRVLNVPVPLVSVPAST